ncbi:hypothetical protein INT80_13945 [Gallibacterium anatis]|uniref:Uncharacterized protein n=1 Tax=Gallibacterium anatis TaxID=750 RepID=A0A930Y5J0_9PAST|nr:hypothetical protein [Gallibacterium anatis]
MRKLTSSRYQKREDEINKLRVDYDKEAGELQKINARRAEEDNKVVESIQK